MSMPLYKFEQLCPGDCFRLKDDDEYRYIRTDDLYDAERKMSINAINLDTGFGTYFFENKPIEELIMTLRQTPGKLRYKKKLEMKIKNAVQSEGQSEGEEKSDPV